MPITALPVAPSSASPDTFVARADAFVAALPTLRTEINAALAAFGPGAPFCTAGGTANAITLTSGLSIGSLVAGQSVAWVATADNSGAVTINLDGLGAVAAVKPTGGALPASWIDSGEIMTAVYNGTAWVVFASQAYLDAREPAASLYNAGIAAAANFDLVFGADWQVIEIDVHNLWPVTNGATLRMRLGNGAGVMETGASDYEITLNGNPSVTASSLTLSGGIGSTNGLGYSGRITILGPVSSGARTRVQAEGAYEASAGGGLTESRMKGGRMALAQHQSFSLFASSGNIVATRLTVRGVK